MATTSATEKEFLIARTFSAPIDLMWKAWSEPQRIAQWWGPKGCELEVAKLEFRPGGGFHYGMKMPTGQTMWGRFVYREIEKPDRIVFVNSFSDEKGGVTRAPFSATWPLEILNKLTFTEQCGKTTLTLRGGSLNATAEELATFEGMFPSLQQGFGGTFDQLEEHLTKG